MTAAPVFIDNHGMTIRLDPPTTATASIHLTITEPTIWDSTGERMVQEARVFDIYIGRQAGQTIADTLQFWLDPELNNILGIKP